MFDFFSDHPVIFISVAVTLVLVIILGGVFLVKNTRNIIFNGNEQVIDTNWRYNWGILQLGNGELIEGTITSWKDFSESDMIQFTMDGITYLTHSSNIILCTECP